MYIAVRAREKRSPAACASESGAVAKWPAPATREFNHRQSQRESTTLQTAGVAIAVYNYDVEY